MGIHRQLLYVLLVVFSIFHTPPVHCLDARVRVQLFASGGNADCRGAIEYTLSPPFRVVAPLPLSVPTGDDWHLVLDSAGHQVRLRPSAKGALNTRVRQAGVSGAELQLAPLGKPLSLHVVSAGIAKKTRLINARVFLRFSGGGLKMIAELPTADYVAGVVGSESPPQFHLEALKAQSVLVQKRHSRCWCKIGCLVVTQGKILPMIPAPWPTLGRIMQELNARRLCEPLSLPNFGSVSAGACSNLISTPLVPVGSQRRICFRVSPVLRPDRLPVRHVRLLPFTCSTWRRCRWPKLKESCLWSFCTSMSVMLRGVR